MNRKLRIYTDTSVFGGCEDDDFAEHSNRLMESFAEGVYTLVLSPITIQELAGAPARVRQRLELVPEPHVELLPLDAESMDLSSEYIEAGVISAKMRADAQHIAVASVGRVDVVVSWNFKHVVNLQRIRGYNSVNLRLGYPIIEIRTPREVLLDD